MARRPPPVILLAFANEEVGDRRFLRSLRQEQRALLEALEPAVARGWCDPPVLLPDATLEQLLGELRKKRLRDRVRILHYGGHAGSGQLLFEGETGGTAGAQGEGLAVFLGQQRGLELVFLNACATYDQVDALLAAGVSAVIATEVEVDDATATGLASSFYRSLAAGVSLERAFAEASGDLLAGGASEDPPTAGRSFDVDPAAAARAQRARGLPWKLHLSQGAEDTARWSLPLAAGDELAGLPPLPELDLPEEPFRHLGRFEREQAALFFGRDREIRQLYEAVTDPAGEPILFLTGATGVGKSSLLHAGLIPRLEAEQNVRYLRRDDALGLAGTLARSFEVEPRGAAIAAAWRQAEAEAERPLSVVLDQVEEAVVRGEAGELEEFAAQLRPLLGRRHTRPRGRLILGFRKEWLLELRNVLRAQRLPRRVIDLERLDRRGIVEAIAGVTRYPTYQVELEDGLAELIADDLLADRESPAAPTLQILLTKLWQSCEAEDPGAPKRFTRERYQALKDEGLLLADFVDQQLADVRALHPEGVDSGLALDLLAQHTTPLGVARAHDAAALLGAYAHAVTELRELLPLLKERYLLAGTLRAQDGELSGRSRLAHDTLAPIVRARFETSRSPGQRARRILESRSLGWGEARSSLRGAPLGKADLAEVERGLTGMRAPHPDEERLLTASRDLRAAHEAEQAKARAERVELEARERAARVAQEKAERAALEGRQRRARLMFRGALAVALTFLAGAGVALWWGVKANQLAKHARDNARVGLAGSQIDPLLGLLLLCELEEEPAPEEALATALRIATRPIPVAQLQGHEDWIHGAAFSADGRRVVTAGGDGTVRVWAADGRGAERILGRELGLILAEAQLTRDGRRVLTGDGQGRWTLWSPETSEPPRSLSGGGVLSCAALSPDGRLVVGGGSDGKLWLWNVEEVAPPRALRPQRDAVSRLAFDPTGTRVVSCGPRSVFLQDLAGETHTLELDLRGADGRHAPPRLAMFSPDGRELLVLGEGAGAQRASLPEGFLRRLDLPEDTLRGAAYAPDGRRLVLWGRSEEAYLVELRTGTVEVLHGHRDAIVYADFSPDGRLLATGSQDGSARVWSTDEPTPRVFSWHPGWVRRVAFSPDGLSLLTASDDGTARVWPLGTTPQPERPELPGDLRAAGWSAGGLHAAGLLSGRPVAWVAPGTPGTPEPLRLEGHTDRLVGLALSPDGTQALTSSQDGTLRRWAVPEAEGTVLLDQGAQLLSGLVFSADGRSCLAYGEEPGMRLWTASGEALLLDGHAPGEGQPFAVLAPHGRTALTVAADGALRLWSAATAWNPVPLVGHAAGGVRAAAFDPDGTRVVTVGADGARSWNVARGVLERAWERASDPRCVAFSRDGSSFATGGGERLAIVYPTQGEGTPLELGGHTGAIRDLDFSPDGKHLVTAGEDKTCLVWTLDGSTPPLTLWHGHAVVRARYSPQGDRVLTLGPAGELRVWTVTWPAMRTLLRRSTRASLGRRERVRFLREDEATAGARAEAARQEQAAR